jgi:hypothetical protein
MALANLAKASLAFCNRHDPQLPHQCPRVTVSMLGVTAVYASKAQDRNPLVRNSYITSQCIGIIMNFGHLNLNIGCIFLNVMDYCFTWLLVVYQSSLIFLLVVLADTFHDLVFLCMDC